MYQTYQLTSSSKNQEIVLTFSHTYNFEDYCLQSLIQKTQQIATKFIACLGSYFLTMGFFTLPYLITVLKLSTASFIIDELFSSGLSFLQSFFISPDIFSLKSLINDCFNYLSFFLEVGFLKLNLIYKTSFYLLNLFGLELKEEDYQDFNRNVFNFFSFFFRTLSFGILSYGLNSALKKEKPNSDPLCQELTFPKNALYPFLSQYRILNGYGIETPLIDKTVQIYQSLDEFLKANIPSYATLKNSPIKKSVHHKVWDILFFLFEAVKKLVDLEFLLGFIYCSYGVINKEDPKIFLKSLDDTLPTFKKEITYSDELNQKIALGAEVFSLNNYSLEYYFNHLKINESNNTIYFPFKELIPLDQDKKNSLIIQKIPEAINKYFQKPKISYLQNFFYAQFLAV
jgi:hypothetical protein